MNNSDIEIIKKEIDNIFNELDNLDYQNKIVVQDKIMDWTTLRIVNKSEKIALLKLLQKLSKHIK
jgi:hypothetical protein